MPGPRSLDSHRAVCVKRLPWMRRIHVYSPKVDRMLVLFSHQAVALWALAESSPLIKSFCEYPGYVQLDGKRVLADLWVSGDEREMLVKFDGGIDLTPEAPDQVPTYTDVEVSRVTSDWLDRYAQWTDNWLQINPYLVANGRFVTPEMTERVLGLFDDDAALYQAEHAMRDTDAQLVRTAIFTLLHRGRLRSDDLMLTPLAHTTVFQRGGE